MRPKKTLDFKTPPALWKTAIGELSGELNWGGDLNGAANRQLLDSRVFASSPPPFGELGVLALFPSSPLTRHPLGWRYGGLPGDLKFLRVLGSP